MVLSVSPKVGDIIWELYDQEEYVSIQNLQIIEKWGALVAFPVSGMGIYYTTNFEDKDLFDTQKEAAEAAVRVLEERLIGIQENLFDMQLIRDGESNA